MSQKAGFSAQVVAAKLFCRRCQRYRMHVVWKRKAKQCEYCAGKRWELMLREYEAGQKLRRDEINQLYPDEITLERWKVWDEWHRK